MMADTGRSNRHTGTIGEGTLAPQGDDRAQHAVPLHASQERKTKNTGLPFY